MTTEIPSCLPVAGACLRNQQAILDVLESVFANVNVVLEIGSGTGQHAVYCAAGLPHLFWQPTDVEDCIDGINMWYEYASLSNVYPPRVLDVTRTPWFSANESFDFDAVFTANTMHFVGWSTVKSLFAGLSEVTRDKAVLAIYGPFNESNRYTSEGNQALDKWLKQRDADSGIKDLADIEALALQYHWKLRQIHKMPANNLLLELQKD